MDKSQEQTPPTTYEVNPTPPPDLSSPTTPDEEKTIETPNLKTKKKITKKILIILIPLLLLLTVGGIIYFLLFFNKPKTTSTSQEATPTAFAFKASVVYLTGEASIIVDDRKVEIKEGDVLKEGDVIQTEKNTYLVLNLDEGTVIRIGEATTITLAKLKPDETVVNEEIGIIFARVEKDENHRFITYAKDITIESLGTVFSVENQDEVNVKVFESKVSVKEGEESVEVNQDKEWKSSNKEITDIDQGELTTNEFLDKSLKEENLINPSPTQKPEPTAPSGTSTTGQISSITLSGSKASSSEASLSWTSDASPSKGFKVVWSNSSGPTFPTREGDWFLYVSSPEVRSKNIGGLETGKVYFFRVCEYLGGSCGTYSNEVLLSF